jgi:hypothetical protein
MIIIPLTSRTAHDFAALKAIAQAIKAALDDLHKANKFIPVKPLVSILDQIINLADAATDEAFDKIRGLALTLSNTIKFVLAAFRALL